MYTIHYAVKLYCIYSRHIYIHIQTYYTLQKVCVCVYIYTHTVARKPQNLNPYGFKSSSMCLNYMKQNSWDL